MFEYEAREILPIPTLSKFEAHAMPLKRTTEIVAGEFYVQPRYSGLRRYAVYDSDVLRVYEFSRINPEALFAEPDKHAFDVPYVKDSVVRLLYLDCVLRDATLFVVDVIDYLLPQKDRIEILKSLSDCETCGLSVVIAPTVLTKDVRTHIWKHLWQGYAGSVLRPKDSMYAPYSDCCLEVMSIAAPTVIHAVIEHIGYKNDEKCLQCVTASGVKFVCPVGIHTFMCIGDFVPIRCTMHMGHPVNPKVCIKQMDAKGKLHWHGLMRRSTTY